MFHQSLSLSANHVCSAGVSRRSALRWLLQSAVITAVPVLSGACRLDSGTNPAPRPSTAAPQVSDTAAPSTPLATVRVGSGARTLAGVGMYVAAERGYFVEQGLDVTLSELAASDVFPALGSGQVDAISSAVGPALFNAATRGIRLKIVAPMTRHDPGASSSFFLVRRDLVESGHFRGYADLAGKRIALGNADTVGPYILSRALNKAGVQAAVETVLLDFPEITAAFANGAIDVAIQPEPTASASVGRGLAVKWREVSDVVPGVQNTVVVFGSRLVNGQQEVGLRWVTAYLKGVRDYYAGILKHGTGRPDIVSILTRWTPVADPTLYDTMGFPFIDPNGEVSQESLTDELRYLRDKGQVTGPIEVEQVVESGFVAGAVQKLGRYQS